jgi:acetyl esterase/lipase
VIPRGSRPSAKKAKFSLSFNLAVIEYTLAPAVRLDRIVSEVRRSVRWLAGHLGECGADPNRLYVAGHSAGGHLTAMTMPLAEVRGGMPISGIFDLEPIRLNYLNEKLGLDTAEAERNSPVRHLPAKAGELVVAYGTRELPELCRQSIEYGRRWTERGLPGHLLPVDGADHFTILDALARPEGVLTRALQARPPEEVPDSLAPLKPAQAGAFPQRVFGEQHRDPVGVIIAVTQGGIARFQVADRLRVQRRKH